MENHHVTKHLDFRDLAKEGTAHAELGCYHAGRAHPLFSYLQQSPG